MNVLSILNTAIITAYFGTQLYDRATGRDKKIEVVPDKGNGNGAGKQPGSGQPNDSAIYKYLESKFGPEAVKMVQQVQEQFSISAAEALQKIIEAAKNQKEKIQESCLA